ncbi:MAG TPA: VacJ family lipoprotein [Chthoniobacterales bacterium]
MKIHPCFLSILLIGGLAPLLTSCASRTQPEPAAPAAAGPANSEGKSVQAAADDLNEYEAVAIADPLESANRATFWLNHQLYTFLLRPISKTYEKVVPKPVRTGVYNAFDNVKFPVRFVNDTLQGNFKRAGQETGRFVVNSVMGFGGIVRQSDRFPALADVPAGETGQTFAKWGVGHGTYVVLPVLGPSSLRDTVGLAGDYALNPVTWVSIVFGSYAWIVAIPATDTTSALPGKFSQYDAATQNTLDPYLAARSSYAQSRKEAASK